MSGEGMVSAPIAMDRGDRIIIDDPHGEISDAERAEIAAEFRKVVDRRLADNPSVEPVIVLSRASGFDTASDPDVTVLARMLGREILDVTRFDRMAFGYGIADVTLTIENNLTVERVPMLPRIDHGNFEVTGSMTAYFTNPEPFDMLTRHLRWFEHIHARATLSKRAFRRWRGKRKAERRQARG